MRLELLFLKRYIFTIVEEKFEISYPRCAFKDKFWSHSFSLWLKKFWSSVPLDTSWMTNFDKIHLHHDWRKIWNSTLLESGLLFCIDQGGETGCHKRRIIQIEVVFYWFKHIFCPASGELSKFQGQTPAKFAVRRVKINPC